VLPEIKSLESSLRHTHLFIGGGRDDDFGIAKICVVRFDKSMALVSEKTVGVEGMFCVYVIERMENEEVIFAGGFGSVSVLYFNETEGKLETLKNFEDITTDEILDLKFYNNFLYAVSPAQEEIAKLEFCFVNRKNSSFQGAALSKAGDYLKTVTENYTVRVEELPGKNSLHF
jgi:hypothetical protein